MGHDHSHCKHGKQAKGKRLFWAVVINLSLTLVQVIGGVFSGSISLIADALHNLSDAGALVIAFYAQKISMKPATKELTFGYGRAETIGALINSISLVFVGLYLLIEAGQRLMNPHEIDGLIVVLVAGFALVVDLLTAFLTYKHSKESLNMRAVFIHNISDALASVAVILSGLIIMFYEVYWVDFVATLIISAYVVWHSWDLIKSCIRTLMQAVPPNISVNKVKAELEHIGGVSEVHHIHIWALDEQTTSLEGHVTVQTNDLKEVEKIKNKIKDRLKSKFGINHSTLEFESMETDCAEDCV